MAVKHLGQFAQPRESDLSGLSEGISKGLGLREQRKTREASTQAAETSANIKKQELSSALAKEERVEEDKNRKLAVETRKRISLRLMGKSEAEQQTVLDSPSIQELTKTLIKPYLPEGYDEETKRIIPERLKFYPKNEEEARDMAVKRQEAMNEVAAGKLPSITQLGALKDSVASMAWSLNLDQDPRVLKQIQDIEKMEKQAMDLIKDANPNAFTNGLGGGTSEKGDWWNK